jgi:hypothetical protein
MNRVISLLLVTFLTSLAVAQSTQPSWQSTPSGEILLRPFKNAAYPHESRKDGWKYQTTTYSAADHYSDSTVGIVIPRNYRPGDTVDYIIHFHGWNNHVAKVLPYYQLPEQLAESDVNAILLVPQGPKDANDSGDGHLELDKGAAMALLEEVTAFLNSEGKIHTTKIGKVALTTHSGGYKVTAAIAAIGGLDDHLSDIILLDSSYGSLASFATWTAANPNHRLVSMFTDHLHDTNMELMGWMLEAGVTPVLMKESDVNGRTMSERGALFFHTDLPHDEVPMGKKYFKLMLKTSEVGK